MPNTSRDGDEEGDRGKQRKSIFGLMMIAFIAGIFVAVSICAILITKVPAFISTAAVFLGIFLVVMVFCIVLIWMVKTGNLPKDPKHPINRFIDCTTKCVDGTDDISESDPGSGSGSAVGRPRLSPVQEESENDHDSGSVAVVHAQNEEDEQKSISTEEYLEEAPRRLDFSRSAFSANFPGPSFPGPSTAASFSLTEMTSPDQDMPESWASTGTSNEASSYATESLTGVIPEVQAIGPELATKIQLEEEVLPGHMYDKVRKIGRQLRSIAVKYDFIPLQSSSSISDSQPGQDPEVEVPFQEPAVGSPDTRDDKSDTGSTMLKTRRRKSTSSSDGSPEPS